MDDTIIRDESGDKKYFTQIPNIIVNHSTAFEQSLYLIMKRLAGEGGYCYASLNFLANKMGVHRLTVTQTIAKLLKRKWIKETDKTKVKGGYTRTFIIVDLWGLNIKNYEEMRGESQVPTSRGESAITRGESQITASESQIDTTKKSNKIYNKKCSSFKKEYYRGMLIVKSKGKEWCIPQNGAEWLEFDRLAAAKEDIILK